MYIQKKQENPLVTGNEVLPQATSTAQTPVSQTANWKIYRSDKYEFEFKYPVAWVVVKTKDNEITLTSPNGGANDITLLVSPTPTGKTLNINCQPSGGEDVNSIVDGFHSEECKNLKNANGVQYARGINAGMSTGQTYRTRTLRAYFLNSQASVILQTVLTDNIGNTTPSTATVFDAILQSIKFTIQPSAISHSSLQTTCIDQQEAVPVIVSISPASGPVGTKVSIRGCNFWGFEGDLNAIFVRSDGAEIPFVGNVYNGYDEADRGKIMLVTVQSYCESGSITGIYSGITSPCQTIKTTPGIYKVYVTAYGKKSNEATFTIQ